MRYKLYRIFVFECEVRIHETKKRSHFAIKGEIGDNWDQIIKVSQIDRNRRKKG